MCRVECSSFARFASPYSSAEALVMPSNRHCERSTGVVSVLVKVKSAPLPTTMSVRVPPLSILIRRSMIVPFRLGVRRAAGLGAAGGCSECPECRQSHGCDLSHIWTPVPAMPAGLKCPYRPGVAMRWRWGGPRACTQFGLETCLTFGHPQITAKRRPGFLDGRSRCILGGSRGERRAQMVDVAARRQRITAARAGFLATGSAEDSDVPNAVTASWRRSRIAGVDASTSEASYHSDLDISSRLVRCSRPIIDRLSEETANIPLSIAVTDGKARLLTRVDNSRTIGLLLDNVSFAPGFDYAEGGMGTNGVGTVFESGQPIQIVGPEHFHELLQPFACSGTPIRDPLSGRIEGVLDISCLVEHSSPLMHALVRSAAHDIERNLLIDRSQNRKST